MTELLGVIVGAALAYWFNTRQSHARDVERRAAIATALLSELRFLENALRKLYDDDTAGLVRGAYPATLIMRLDPDCFTLSARTIGQLLHLRGVVSDAQMYRDSLSVRAPGQIGPTQHHRTRAFAGFAAGLVPPLVASLKAEGGTVEGLPDFQSVTYPQLPTLPDRAFPLNVDRKQ